MSVAHRFPWRMVAFPLALAWIVVGLVGAYVYGHRYQLYRGFPPPVTPKGVPRGMVRDVHFYSRALGGQHRYLIYLPPHYRSQAARGRRFPVLYLLHGDPGSPEVFLRAGALEVQENVLLHQHRIKPMIVVMPWGHSGVFGGSGTEWANAGGGAYESFVIDVMHNVDAHFATVHNRQGRGIGGLSEGAYGALNITLHHLAQFSVAESWSGYFVEVNSGPFTHEPNSVIRANSPLKYVGKLAPQIHRLGYRAWLYQGQLDNRPPARMQLMSQVLHAAGAEVHYGLFPGGHDWGLWRAQLPRMLMVASDWFATPPLQGAGSLTGSGHAGSPAQIRAYDIARYKRCKAKRAQRIRQGGPAGAPCQLLIPPRLRH